MLNQSNIIRTKLARDKSDAIYNYEQGLGLGASNNNLS